MTRLARRLLGIDECELVYRNARCLASGCFDERVLRAMNVTIDARRDEVARIPRSGPLVVVANHPHGAVDGLALSTLVRRVRDDVRVLANGMLASIPELRELCFFVDPLDGPEAAARSLAGLRAARRWVRRGGALIVFPAGEVAHTRRPDGSYAESPWRNTAARLADAAGASVLPAFIDGRNGRWFYTAGRIHATLRTALLPRALLHARGSRIRVRLGTAARPTAAAAQLDAVEALRRQPTASPLESEIDALPADACLLDEGPFEVFCTRSGAIPHVIREIGRLRAETYRDAGEGTGAAIDLDRFDDEYLHLFVWDRTRRLIVGAYRLGETDRIAAERGVDGLYTRTLFRYDARLLRRLPPALELGRSFVRKEYQRSYSALLLLWKGIGRYVARHPRYRVLFGPVSISPRYADSRGAALSGPPSHPHQLLTSFLAQNYYDEDLASLVEALNPPPLLSAPAAAAAEPELPVLLRQYLKLNARVIGFNIDPDFGGVLDALMMVDLAAVDRPLLDRYLGRDASGSYLARHHVPAAAA